MTVIACCRRLAGLALLTSTGAANMFAQQASAVRCGRSDWTAPIPLASTVPQVTRYPSSTWDGKHLIVVGQNFIDFTDERIKRALFAGWRGTTPMRAPSGTGARMFVYPLVTYDPRADVIHLIWGEQDRNEGTAGQWKGVQALWWSRSRDGRHWSEPQRLYRADNIRWTPGHSTDVAVDGSGGVHVVLTGTDSGTSPFLAYLALRQDRWRVVRLPTLVPANYPAIAIAGAQVWIASTDADSARSQNNNSLVVRHSVDGGRTFPRRTVVQAYAERGAHWIHLLRGHGGQLHLVWAVDESGRGEPDVLAHTDLAGAGWTPVTYARLGRFGAPAIAIDASDRIHLVFDDWSDGSRAGHLDYVCWSGEWSESQHLFPGAVTQDPALNFGGRVLRLVFMERTSQPGAPLSYVVITARRAAGNH